MTSFDYLQKVATPNVRAALAYVHGRMEAELSSEQYAYRWPHTLRVADIAARIALESGLDSEALILGGVLHDIGYVRCKTQEDYEDHGLLSAEIGAEFLAGLSVSKEQRDSICYGIRIHTLPPEKHPRPATVLEQSIGDADNIDRFDAYRIYLFLSYENPEKLSPKELAALAENMADKLAAFRRWKFATPAAQAMWESRMAFHEEFYRRLAAQMEITCAWEALL